MHHARQSLAAQNADRERSLSVMRERIARRAAALESAEIAMGIAASEADPALQDLLAAFADVPEFVADADPDLAAEADADAAWLDKISRVGVWQAVIQRTAAAIEAALITAMLRMAGFTGVMGTGRLVQLRQRARAAALRAARDTFSALTRARFRVAHICITARAMRAGRVVAATSAAHARTC